MVQIHESIESAKNRKNPMEEQRAAVSRSLEHIRHKFIIMSGKGGVGKSSTSVNLAIALSRLGCKVGLMDVDLHGPDLPRMLGLSGELGITAERKLAPLTYSENLSVVSIESLTPDKDQAIIWRGPVKFSAIQQFIGDVAWGALDFLLIDAPPGTGDEPLTVAQTIKDAKAIIVTTPQEISLADVRKSINFCKTVKMEIFGLVENMSGFNCPHCGESIEIFGSGGGERTARQMAIPFLGRIPFDQRVVTCADRGISFQEAYPDTPATKAYHAIAQTMAQIVRNKSKD
jgi:ATP-binding protein involved in chromosome partitioning